MSSIFGNNIKVSIFGQSHSAAIGCVIDTIPAGVRIDLAALYAFMERRAPGRNAYSTSRAEADLPEFISGVLPDKDDPNVLITCGAPLCAIIRNRDARSSDYSEFADIPRPGHADYSAEIAFTSYQDVRGGGHFSGRLTAPLCIAGGIIKQMLEQRGIFIGAHVSSVGPIEDLRYHPVRVSRKDLLTVLENPFPTLDRTRGELMTSLIEEVKAEGDSIGGCVECAILGLPAGLGSPMCDGIENRLAKELFAIPAVKGVEFGRGFEAATLKGSENNDSFVTNGQSIVTATNNCGGILGGISNGMPIIFRCAVKPTPTIMKEQESVSLSGMENTVLKARGRHDPCILSRVIPVFEAVAAIVAADLLFDPPKHV